MTNQDYLAPAELHLGTDRARAIAQGPRSFKTAANAIRFAIEHAAPVSLHGAQLKIGDRRYYRRAILALYHNVLYPLPRSPSRLDEGAPE